MSALTIRNIPENVHDALRKIASRRGLSVEALARAALENLAKSGKRGGVDFTKLARDRQGLGLGRDGPAWDEAMDETALSRKVLGLDP